ncbi:hypothetical protein JKP88DRAFT_244669 [Tribonema minus]|uniref:Uncharacterized protein n=1 Tax=Tribonema minus TaxID=303371 RepID=A0A835Z2Y8_9STRA|nr:hypothetical protein JKP88DRAFT_244669 [Tribonema minus]
MALVPWGLTTTERFPACKDEGIPGPGSYDVQEVGAKKKGCGGAIALSLSCHLKKEQLDELRQGVEHANLKRGVSLDGADSTSVSAEKSSGNSKRASLIQRPTRKRRYRFVKRGAFVTSTTAAISNEGCSRLIFSLPATAQTSSNSTNDDACAPLLRRRLDKKCRELERHLEVPGGTAALRTERDALRQQLLEQRKALDSSEKAASELRKAAGQGKVALEDVSSRLADAVACAEAAEVQVETLKGQVAALQLSLQDMQANTDELSAESSEFWQRERARADELQQELNNLSADEQQQNNSRALREAAELDRKRLQEHSDQCSRENAALKQSLAESDKEMAQLHVSCAAETIAHAQTSSQLQDARAEAKCASAIALQLEVEVERARQQVREAEAALARQLHELEVGTAAVEESHKLKLELEAATCEAERLSAANAQLSARLGDAESAAARLSAAAAADTAQLADELKGAREELEWAAAAHSEIADQLHDVKCKLEAEVEVRERADAAARRVTLQLCACQASGMLQGSVPPLSPPPPPLHNRSQEVLKTRFASVTVAQAALKVATAAQAAAETATDAAMRDCAALESDNESLQKEKAQLAATAECLRLDQVQLVAANESLQLEQLQLASANEKLRSEAAKQQHSVDALHELVRVQEEVVAITKQDKSDLAQEHSKLLAKAEHFQLSHAAAVHKQEWLHLQVKALKKDREQLKGEVAAARNQQADSAQLQQQCSTAEAALGVAVELMRAHEVRHGCGLSAAAAELTQRAAERAAAAEAQVTRLGSRKAAEAREGHATLTLTVAELAQHWENKENRANAEKDLVAQQQRVASLRRELQEARAVAAAAMTSPMVDQLQLLARDMDMAKRVLLKAGLLQPHASATSAAGKKKAFANALKPSNIVAPTISTIAKRTVKKSMLNAAALSMVSDTSSPEGEGTIWSQRGALWARQSTATNSNSATIFNSN